MTHIEQMIKDMCPHGVEWKTFAELGTFYGGLSGKNKDDFKDGNAKYITYLNIGCNPALRFDILETVKIGPNEKQNTIQYGDALFTGSSETPDECAMSSVVTEQPTEDIYLNSFCFGFRFNSLDDICPAFYKHYFRCDAFRKAVRRTANGTTRFNVSKKEFAKLEIPIPPIEIQKKIVECLDKFSALAAELQAELQMRRKQYEYYRTHLLTPHSESNSADKSDDCNWEWKTLDEIAENCDYMRRPITATRREKGEIPYYGASGIVDYVKDYIYDGEYLLISEDGANLIARSTPIAFSIEGKNWVNNHAHVLKFEHRCTQKLVEYYVNSINIEPYVSGGAQPKLNQANLNKIPIPVPSLEEQTRIVEILDKFDKLITSMEEGIPAEQAAQQKRYEYYRDLLLTFDRKLP